MNEQRKAFETYAAARWEDTTTFERDGDSYLHVGINNDWKAWQAAIAAQAPKQAMSDIDALMLLEPFDLKIDSGTKLAVVRAVLAASSPNKELVAALRDCTKLESAEEIRDVARSALRAAGVEAA